MLVQLDFDGTVVEHEYPLIGRCNFGVFEFIKELQDKGHDIVLNTYRADINDGTLFKAQQFLNTNHHLKFKPHNKHLTIQLITKYNTKKIQPQEWDLDLILDTNVIYIDDIAHKIPLKPAFNTKSVVVDFKKVTEQLKKIKVL